MLHEKLTKSDVKKIQEEIEYRKLVIRKEALESVKEARAHGDLSENFEYKAAKQYKNKNESRIRYLEKLLKNAEVIEDHAEFDEVGLNKLVRIYIPEDEEEEEYKVVTSIRGNSVKGYISIESPLGKSLLGHKVGENVYVRVNETYGYEVKILEIRESSDEEDRIRQF
jgi:transcription elongation factor GreA